MKVLIATDGSDFSRKAVEKSVEMLRTAKDSEIRIISLVEAAKPITAESFAFSDDYFKRLEADLKACAEKAVAEALEIVKSKLGDNAPNLSGEVFVGNVRQIILDEAKRTHADLIVVGSHGYGFFGRMLLGSISDFTIHHAPCSVLVIR